MFVITALAVIILSFDASEGYEQLTTEETPLTAPPHSSKKVLFGALMSTFMVITTVLAVLIAFTPFSTSVIVFEVFLGVSALICLILVRVKIPLKRDETDGSLSFVSPGKPFVQGLSILVNLVLLFHLEVKALKQLAIYCFVGMIIYFGYGIFFSKVTEEKQKILGDDSISLDSQDNSTE